MHSKPSKWRVMYSAFDQDSPSSPSSWSFQCPRDRGVKPSWRKWNSHGAVNRTGAQRGSHSWLFSSTYCIPVRKAIVTASPARRNIGEVGTGRDCSKQMSPSTRHIATVGANPPLLSSSAAACISHPLCITTTVVVTFQSASSSVRGAVSANPRGMPTCSTDGAPAG